MRVTINIHRLTLAERLARNISDPDRRPKLIGFPHASQGKVGMAEPEAIAFDSLCMFVNGWQGALAYHFPDGFDARYWNAMATANLAISRFEDHVMEGKPQAAHRLKVLTPLPALDPSTARTSGMNPAVSLVFIREFSHKGQRLVAVGNSWKYGDAFVRLAFDDVPLNGKFALLEPLANRCYSSENGRVALTQRDLSEGMVVHVGALRFAFFLLVPYQPDTDYGRILSPSTMNSALKTYRQNILQALSLESGNQ